MTATFTTDKAAIPRRVLIDLMDHARRAEENARRQHDRIAYELGIERVRVDDLAEGDTVEFAGLTYQVAGVQLYTDEIASWYRVTFGSDQSQFSESYDEGQFVTRVLPKIEEEPF